MSKILIIEDESTLSNALHEALINGDEIEIEADGSKAFQRVKEYKPDLILLDLFLPGKPGEVILEEIRSDAETKNIPVLVATVKADKEAREICQKLGISGYFIKAHHTLKEIATEAKKILHK
ncbi:MAG: response regulator [Patescibacteria group bacterium]|jgi:CheY-like chemotaxis protein